MDEAAKNWKTSGFMHKMHQSLIQYPSSEVSSSLAFRACPLEPAFGQMHTSLVWASLYPIDWGWVCHWIRIKVLRLSINGGRAMRGTCQRFVCCQGLVSARRRYGCRIAKTSNFSSCSKVTSRSNHSLVTVIMKIRLLINHYHPVIILPSQKPGGHQRLFVKSMNLRVPIWALPQMLASLLRVPVFLLCYHKTESSEHFN